MKLNSFLLLTVLNAQNKSSEERSTTLKNVRVLSRTTLDSL